jgi:hypothetical protein
VSIDLSDRLGSAGDQGNRSTCLAFAATAGHMLARVLRRAAPLVELSEEALYHLAKEIDGNQLPGTTPASVGRALRQSGQPDASRWPYDSTLNDADPLPAPPADALDPEALRKASLTDSAAGLEQLETALRQGHGVVLGFEVWTGLYEPDGGALDVPTPDDLLGDGHAVLLVGVDLEARRLLIRNSWSRTWGHDGHAWMPEPTWRRVRLGAWLVRDDVDPT